MPGVCQEEDLNPVIWKMIISSLAGRFHDFAQKNIDLPSLLTFYPIFLLVLGLQISYAYLREVPSVFPGIHLNVI